MEGENMKDRETKSDQLVAIALNNQKPKENLTFPREKRIQEDSYGSCSWGLGKPPAISYN
jgi:hypothetical protein